MSAQPVKTTDALLYDLRDVRSRLESLAQRLAENATRERAWGLLLEHLPVAVWCTDRDLKLGFAIGAGLEGLGWSCSEIGNMSLQDFLRCDNTDAIMAAHQRALEGHTSSEEMVRGDRIFYAHISPQLDDEGQVASVVAVALDITERRQAEQTLRRIELSTSAIRNALPDIILHMSRDGYFREVHAPDPTALVAPSEDLVGRPIEQFLPPELAARCHIAITRALETGEVQVIDYSLVLEGCERHFEARLASLSDDEIIIVIREISRREDALRALRSSRKQLATYNDIVVHDLANFSMSMQLLVTRLLSEQDGTLSPAQHNLLQRANRQTYEMGRLAENARVLTQLHEGSLGGPPQSIDVIETLDTVIDRVRATHFHRQFEVDLHAPASLTIQTTRFIENVLVNLLDNAVRYGIPSDDGKRFVEIKVFELLARIQVRFRNPSRLEEREVESLLSVPRTGSSLGITLVRDVIERAGGSIEARVITRDSTRFFELNFTLPKAGAWDAS